MIRSKALYGLIMALTLTSKMRLSALGFLLFVVLLGVSPAHANDLPTAAGSPIAGIAFDDRPLILPVQRNFQMAMLTASSELGRSCGRLEAYGWRMSEAEQDRVNQIFDNSVDRLRAQGYSVETKNASTVSKDVTLFTADRADKHLIFMWSAGEIGLVLVMCETSAPLAPMALNKAALEVDAAPRKTVSPAPAAASPARLTKTGKPVQDNFSPIGDWVGDYTCSQGTTGATLHIDELKGDQFEGTFHFYPTTKNPYVSRGKYKVFGEYDRDSLRILVNPGKWIERPKDFYSTIMIGSFDPVAMSFSGFFQGITGCTSFEAKAGEARRAATAPVPSAKKKAAAPAKAKTAKPKKKKAKVPAKVEEKPAADAAPAPAPTPARNSSIDPIPAAPSGIELSKP